MSLLIASLPYFIVALFIMVFLESITFLKWTWKPPPSYVRFIAGILWPIWILAAILYGFFGGKITE